MADYQLVSHVLPAFYGCRLPTWKTDGTSRFYIGCRWGRLLPMTKSKRHVLPTQTTCDADSSFESNDGYKDSTFTHNMIQSQINYHHGGLPQFDQFLWLRSYTNPEDEFSRWGSYEIEGTPVSWTTPWRQLVLGLVVQSWSVFFQVSAVSVYSVYYCILDLLFCNSRNKHNIIGETGANRSSQKHQGKIISLAAVNWWSFWTKDDWMQWLWKFAPTQNWFIMDKLW